MNGSPATGDPVFPMFVGCGRSGTTLFRNIFDSHPDLAMTHEAHFIAPMGARRERYTNREGGLDIDVFVADLFADSNFRRQGLEEGLVRRSLEEANAPGFAEAVRVVFGLYAAAQGKPLYGDKTPGSVTHIELLGSLFPEARFVHIIRDGRAVALSYLERPEWGPKTMAEAAQHWKSRVTRGRRGGEALGRSRYREVKYEDMVADPERVTRELCEFLGLGYAPDMLDYHRRGAEFIAETKDPEAFKNLAKPVTKDLRDWRDQMSAADAALFEAIAGDLLVDLGYEVQDSGNTVRARTQALVSAAAWQGKRAMAFVSRRAARRRAGGPEES